MKKKFLDLGKQPIANRFIDSVDIGKEFFYNLSVGFDVDTKLITHMEYIDAPMMFNENYTFIPKLKKIFAMEK